jgi:glutaredoxin
MKIIIFGKPGCSACQKVKEKMEYFAEKETPIAIDYFDVETVDGLAESAYRGIPEIPTVILVDEDKDIKRWVQSAPTFSELKELLKSH